MAKVGSPAEPLEEVVGGVLEGLSLGLEQRRAALLAVGRGKEAGEAAVAPMLGHLSKEHRAMLKAALDKAVVLSKELAGKEAKESEWLAALLRLQLSHLIARARRLIESTGEANHAAMSEPAPDAAAYDPLPTLYKDNPKAIPALFDFTADEEKGREALAARLAPPPPPTPKEDDSD